jgi:hypothetical protein
MAQRVKFLVERHADGYVAHPLGLRRGVAVVGQGGTYQEALSDAVSALRFTLETLPEAEVFDEDYTAQEVFVAEAEVTVSTQVPR